MNILFMAIVALFMAVTDNEKATKKKKVSSEDYITRRVVTYDGMNWKTIEWQEKKPEYQHWNEEPRFYMPGGN